MPLQIPNTPDATFPAQAGVDSRDIDIIVAGHDRTGVVAGCAVTAQGSPDMTVAVAAGVVRVTGRQVAVTAGNVTATTAHATNPRHDLVVVNAAGTKSVVAGTAAAITSTAEPTFPTIPADSVVLAAVYVPAAVTAINTNQIIDKRIMLRDGSNRVLPETYGAVGDARRVMDATITSGGTTVTSATAAFTSGDTGKSFVFVGAGTGGALLRGTFTYISATTGTLSAAAGATVSSPGLEFWLGADDTVPIQQALNAARWGDTVYLDPTKSYLHQARTQGGCSTTAGLTTFTAGAAFSAGDVGKSVGFEFSQNNVFCTYITAVAGTTITVATAIPTTNASVAVQVGHITVLNHGTGISGHGTLVSTDQQYCATVVYGVQDAHLRDFLTRNPNTSREVLRWSCALFVWSCSNLTILNVNVDGAGATGIYTSLLDVFTFEHLTVQNTRADGVHMTNQTRYGIVESPITRYCGDDGVAVVSYTFDVGICRDIKVYSPRCMGEIGGRGVAVVGGQDITYHNVYVERTSASAIYVASEETVNVTTLGCKDIRIIGGEVVNGNTAAAIDHGSVTLYNGQQPAGYILENVSIEGIRIRDSRRTASANVIVNTNSNSGALRRIQFAQFTIEGGVNLNYYAGGAPDSATQVNRYAWLVDGKTIADVIPWGSYTPITFADGTVGGWRAYAAVYGGLTVVQQPVATGEYLTPFHTTRATRLMVAGDSGKVFFSRVDVTKKGGQAFTAASVNVTAVQVTGTVNSRMGLYADDGSGSRPTGAALYDWGATTVLTSTGLRSSTITATTVPPGVYWLAWGWPGAIKNRWRPEPDPP